MTTLGLGFCGELSLAASRDCSLVGVHRILIAEHELWGAQASVVAAHGLSSCNLRPLEPRLSIVVQGLS